LQPSVIDSADTPTAVRRRCGIVVDVKPDVVYSVVLRPGMDDQQSADGLDAQTLDKWISAHGNPGDGFEYSWRSCEGERTGHGFGAVDGSGDAAYRLSS
jgi:hypothetical protein